MVPDSQNKSRKNLDKSDIERKSENEEYVRGEYSASTGEPSFTTDLMVKIQYSIMVLAAIFNEILRNLKILKTYYPQERREQSVMFIFLLLILILFSGFRGTQR